MERLIAEAARRIAAARWPIALTGAGVSTESGILDFRGPKGIWRRYNPEDFTLTGFFQNPTRYWKLHMEFFAGLERVKPNRAHYALAKLERMGRLKCVITQNVDGLHQKAGSRNVIEIHGNLRNATCVKCKAKYRMEDVEARVAAGESVPRCHCGGLLKPDVVFFEEALPLDAMQRAEEEALKCDLMLVVGTSAVVYPAAELPYVAKLGRRLLSFPFQRKPSKSAFIVEVNLEATPLTGSLADLSIFGKAGEIIPKIVDEVERILEG